VTQINQLPPSVLVVDDSATVREQLEMFLTVSGFAVTCAVNGVDALQKFPISHPDVILLDVMMPSMDGFQTCQALRQLPNGEQTPIVMLTSLDDVQTITRAYEVGATDFMRKPISPVILTHRLRHILRANKTFQELYLNRESLRQMHAQLESLVLERTLELQRTVELLRHEARERQRAEEELRNAHARLRTLIDNSPLAVVEWDSRHHVQRWSAQAERIFGWQAQEVLGKHPREWRFFPDENLVSQDLEQFQNESCSVVRHQNFRKDGTIIDVEWYNSALRDESGIIVSLLSLAQDITERQQAERLKDELVSTVSHELRTPLTSLRGFAELMLTREFSPEKQRQFLTVIHQESSRLTDLINDFLDLQRMESGKQIYNFTTISLEPLIRDALSVFTSMPGKHAFTLDFTDELPLVHVDAVRLRQVLTNLLSNAVKYSPQGGVISVGSRTDRAFITVWVTDQGIGIPPEVQPQLFSKFFRVNNQDTRSIGGTGLGLALVKEIIEAHNGQVWVKSVLGQGSTFFFSLPSVARMTAQPSPATSKAA